MNEKYCCTDIEVLKEKVKNQDEKLKSIEKVQIMQGSKVDELENTLIGLVINTENIAKNTDKMVQKQERDDEKQDSRRWQAKLKSIGILAAILTPLVTTMLLAVWKN